MSIATKKKEKLVAKQQKVERKKQRKKEAEVMAKQMAEMKMQKKMEQQGRDVWIILCIDLQVTASGYSRATCGNSKRHQSCRFTQKEERAQHRYCFCCL